MVDHITFADAVEEGVVFDVGALVAHLQQVPDRRKKQGIRYPLWLILVLVLFAKLAGENKPAGIAEWVRLRRLQLVSAFRCQRQTVPSLNTIRRTLAHSVSLVELQEAFRLFLHHSYGGQQSTLVTLDGKSLRGTIPKGSSQGVHLLAAYLPSEGVVLMQVAVSAKENELAAAPRLLATLDLRGRVVCGDAMFTHRGLSVQILYQGGDYIWFVKDNQPRLKNDVRQFFSPARRAPGWSAPSLPQEQAKTIQKGHGRLEQRLLTVMSNESDFIDWPGCRQVFKLERRVTQLNTKEETVDTVFGITSLPPERGSATQLLEWTQGYWGIENGLHYRRDVTLLEDATRMTNDDQAHAMAVLNNFTIGLARKLGFDNLASARRTFDATLSLILSRYG